jgi:hypothetical protein
MTSFCSSNAYFYLYYCWTRFLHLVHFRFGKSSLLRAFASTSPRLRLTTRPVPTTLVSFWTPFHSLSLVPLRTSRHRMVVLLKDVNTYGAWLKVSCNHLPFRLHSDPVIFIQPVENENHCDFKKLRSLLIRTHMLDLITTSEDLHYENYRQQQMETRKFGEPKVKKLDNPKFKEEEEQLRKRFTEQVKAEESRFRQWEQHVSLNLLWGQRYHHLYASILSSSRNAIVSTRTWRWLTALSSSSRLNLTTSRSAIAEDQADGKGLAWTLFIFCSCLGYATIPYYQKNSRNSHRRFIP